MHARIAVGAHRLLRFVGLVALCAAAPLLALGCGGSDADEIAAASEVGTAPTAATEATAGPEPEGELCPSVLAADDELANRRLLDERVDAAVADVPVLTALAAALQASGLDLILRQSRGVTILAPLDDAFATDVPEKELDALLLRRQGDLRTLLERHVVEGRYSLDELVEARRVRTLAGRRVGFRTRGGEVRVAGEATVVCADLEVANATIHVVDDVLGR